MAVAFRFALIFLVVLSCTSLLCFASPVVYKNTTVSLQIEFNSNISSFFLKHYSLNKCAFSVVLNNSCPGNEQSWYAPQNYLQLKELCSDFAIFSTCLRKTICQVCSSKGSNGTSAINVYCAKKQNGSSAIETCEQFSLSNSSSNQKSKILFALNFVWQITLVAVLLISITVTLYLLIFK